MKKTKGIKKTKNTRSALRVEALEQRQLLAGITGGGEEVLSNLVHANGNVYDQVKMTGSSVTVTADAGQITRVSFLDIEGDIVQAEFSGAGSMTITLDTSSGAGYATGVAPVKYNQSGVTYVQGLASFTVQGSDASTNVNIFTVGKSTAVNQALFDSTHTGGNNIANVARLAIVANPANPSGSTFGSIYAGNASFADSSGTTGIYATNVQVQGKVTIGDINASGTAIPYLVFGTNSQFGTVKVAGGDLVNDNKASINNTGSYGYQLNLAAGETSAGTALPAATTGSSLTFTGSNPLNASAKNLTLTTGIDTFVGSSVNDTFNATDTTLTALDSVDGGDGTDVLNFNDTSGTIAALPGGVSIKNVETLNVRSSGAITLDVSSISGLTSANFTQATAVTAKAGSSTALTISGITGAITANGGTSVTASTSASGALSIGATTAPSGAITATHSAQAANSIAIQGGTTVDLTASALTTGTVTIGSTTKPSGAVTVTSTGATYDATADLALGAVSITGGSTISVTQTAAAADSDPTTDTSAQTVTQSAVTVTGGNSTTSVSVTESPAVTAVNYTAAVAAGTKETAEVTFVAMAKGDTLILGGLTFTAQKALTATEAAAAFANIANNSAFGGSAAGNGIYSGTLSGWSTGAVSSDKVTFTNNAFGNVANLTNTGSLTPSVTTVDGSGSASAKATTGVMGVVGGTVAITDGSTGTDTISSVTLSGYGATSTITSDSLATLSLANSAQKVTVTNGTTTTLGLTVNNLASGANLVDFNNKYTTVNVTTTGSNSNLDIDATAVANLTVAGSKVLTLNAGSTLSGLKTVTVSGTAGLTTNGVGSGSITSIDTTATTGAVSASIDPGAATYTGGAGADTVTLVTTTNPTKAISLGAGSDTLTLAAGTTTSTSTLDGGDGTDTISMAAADAATASATTTFQDKIVGFERLQVGTVAAATTNTVNLDNLDDINYVISAGGGAATSVLNIDNAASGGTLSITAGNNAATVTDVDLTSTTPTDDTFNVIITNANGIEAGVINLAGIETINLTATDSNTSAIGTHTGTLTADSAKTVNVSGNANLTLTLTGSNAVTLLDGSSLTGVLTASGNGTVAQTTKGGSKNDVLTASYQGDVLYGNAGDDTLKANGKSLVSLYGGAGNDTFDLGSATVNVNSYATIQDLAAGDVIKFVTTGAGATKFVATSLNTSIDASTAVFQDYANAAIKGSSAGDVSWFQYSGNTYIVQNLSGGSSFTNGTDAIIKVSGQVDLNTAVFSDSADSLKIV